MGLWLRVYGLFNCLFAIVRFYLVIIWLVLISSWVVYIRLVMFRISNCGFLNDGYCVFVLGVWILGNCKTLRYHQSERQQLIILL